MGLFKDCGCGCGGAKAQQKFLISVMSALVFFVISNPDTYRLTRTVFGLWVAGPTGCPTLRGLVLHTVVFVLITWAMMNIKKEGYAIEGDVEMVGPSPEGEVDAEEMEAQLEEEEMEVPPSMADAPSPLPGFSEMQFDVFDSGAELAPLDVVGGEADTPAPLDAPMDAADSGVSCRCDDGSSLTISR